MKPSKIDLPEKNAPESLEEFDEEFEDRLDDEFELELPEELDELFDDELELELLDEFELELLEEFELEFDELFEEELDELLPATMIEPSLPVVFVPAGLMSGAGPEYCLASAVPVASAATPAISADFNFQCPVIAVTPVLRTCMVVLRSNGPREFLFRRTTKARATLQARQRR